MPKAVPSLPSARCRWGFADLRVSLTLMAALLALLPAGSPRRALKDDTKLVLRNLYLRNCPDSAHYVRLVEPVHVRRLRDGMDLVDANFTCPKKIRNVHYMAVKMNRCREVVSHDTCEYFTTWSWKLGICRLVTLPNMMWSPIYEMMEPRFKCPAEAGTYHFRNGTFDVDNPTFRSVFEGYVWTGTFTAKDQDDNTCVCLEGAMQGIKVRRID